MKKTILLAALLVAMSSVAFAADTEINSTDGTAMNGITFKTSVNVTIRATADDVSYTVASKHQSGTIVYGSSNSDAIISEISNADTNKGLVLTTAEGAVE